MKQKYPKLDSHTSYYVIPNLVAFGGYTVWEKVCPPPPDPSIAVFCPGKDNFLKFCSDKRGWDGFCNI